MGWLDRSLEELPSLGWAAVAWIERFLPHGPGDVVGEPQILDDEMAQFIVSCYRLFPKGHEREGRRVYRRAVLSRPKGRAKSELAGSVVCFEAIGDCRFSHWARKGESAWWGYEYQPGEPVGVPVVSPFIRCLATEAQQAGNTYDNVRVMMAADPVTDAYPGIDVGRTRVFLPDGGEIRPSTASGASKDGGKESHGVDDETHIAESDELRDMHAVVLRNMRKRKAAEPWMLETTTAYRPGMDSIAERAAEWAQQLGTPEAQAEAGLLYDHREAPAVDDIRDPAKVIPALRQVYGAFSVVLDLEQIASDMQDPSVDEADARRYWLNQSTSGSNSWLTVGEINDLFCENVPDLEPGEPVCLGFDGSRYHDATVLFACAEDWRMVPLAAWAHDGTADWEVPELEVIEAVRSAHEQFAIVLAYGDPPYWETTIAEWAARWPGLWRGWSTQSESRMAGAVGALTSSIRSGQVRIPKDARYSALAREHFVNCRRKPVSSNVARNAMKAGNPVPFTLQKDRKGSPRKIDSAPAAVLAHEAARDAHTKNLWDRARRRNKRRRLVQLTD